MRMFNSNACTSNLQKELWVIIQASDATSEIATSEIESKLITRIESDTVNEKMKKLIEQKRDGGKCSKKKDREDPIVNRNQYVNEKGLGFER